MDVLFTDLAKTYGPGYAIAIVFVYWMATRVIMPWKERHFKFLDAMEKTITRLADVLAQHADRLDRIDEDLKAIDKKLNGGGK